MAKTTCQYAQDIHFEHSHEAGDIMQAVEEKYKPEEKMENAEDMYVALLHKVLGQELAEYFLSSALPTPSSTLQLGTFETEALNARDFWRHLREESEARLSQHVSMLPGKRSNSEFVPVPSSSFSGRFKQFMRTLELMCQVSESNQDKALFIMSNIPQSDLDKLLTKESPMPYLFKECIENRKEIESEKQFHIKPLNSPKKLLKKKSLIRKIKIGNQSYRLATEETFISEGEFSIRLHDRREGSHRPISYNKSIYIKQPSFSASKEESACEHASGNGTCDITWEPLTYTALLESRPSVTVPGKGAFRSGQARQWFVRSAIINHQFS